MKCGIGYNVMIMRLRMGLKLNSLDSLGVRKDRGCERWIEVRLVKLHMKLNVSLIDKCKCGG